MKFYEQELLLAFYALDRGQAVTLNPSLGVILREHFGFAQGKLREGSQRFFTGPEWRGEF